MKPNEFKENSWRRLLDEIERGQVIPIIGPELLTINVNGKSTYLYDWLASELAYRFEIDFPTDKNFDISDVIYQYKSTVGNNYDPTQPYYEIYDIMRDVTFEVPESLKILARIEKITLFISTTFDDYMEKALKACRGEHVNVESLSFAKSGKIVDITLPINNPVVYHMFGKVNTLPTYVVTEKDLLEFYQKWYDPAVRPPHLNSVLKDKEKYYMLLGCSFENWLTRFFLYGVKSESLFDPGARKGVIADCKSADDQQLAFFLSRCNTNLYTSGNAIEFIKELGIRWRERTTSKKTTPNEIPNQQISDGTFFLSYAHEDLATAQLLKISLEKKEINVWLDKRDILCGEEWEKKIEQAIGKSSFFIALITKNTISKKNKFVQREWRVAIDKLEDKQKEKTFNILPLLKSDISEKETLIPDKFKKLHWSRFHDIDFEDFSKECQNLLRNYNYTNN